MPPGLRTVSVVRERVESGARHWDADVVAAEEPLEIRLVYTSAAETRGPAAPSVLGRPLDQPNERLATAASTVDEREAVTSSVSITMRTPGHDFELAVGFLYTEGIIQGADDVERVSYCVDGFVEQQYNVVNVYLRPGASFDPDRLARNFYTTSSCGVCGKASLDALRVAGCRPVAMGPTVAADVLRTLPATLRASQPVFDETGGLHAAGLFNVSGNLVVLREDVGRHNAVDKLVGERVLVNGVPLDSHVLLVSGRASFEIMQKAAVAGIPIVAAVGAPSSLAVSTAQEFGMSLIGFLRSGGFNVYTGSERVSGSLSNRRGRAPE